MKKFSIAFLILIFVSFFIYESGKSVDFKVLKIISPTKIVVDINQNGVEDKNETIVMKNIDSFTTKGSKSQSELARRLKIPEANAIKMGYLAEIFAKKLLLDKKVKLKDKNTQILVENKNYEDILLKKGFAVEKLKKPPSEFWTSLKKTQKLNLIIFNNKSHKYHKLDCKYGIIAHNSQILPVVQLPKDAKPCKFCFSPSYKKQIAQNKHFNKYIDVIPDIKSPPTFLRTNSTEIFLTDLTKVLKPSNSCDTAVCKTLLREINSARDSIDFAIYGYTKIPKLQQALLNAQQRNVKIRFVYDSDEKNQNIYPDTNYLSTIFTENNHDTNSKLMHNKFFIFDNKKVLTGSANISNTDMSGFNSNVIILVDSPEIAKIYTEEFEQMFNGNFHKQKSKITDKNDILCNSEILIYFSPKDKPLTKQVVPIINQAKKYIYIPAFLITHKEMTNALINASHRGVAVRIILDATNTHSGSHSKIKELRGAGIQVKTENWAGKLHSKSMIIDDLYTIIGSMNFSRSGEEVNDENLIVIKNPQIAIFYKTFFQYLWKRIPDKWLKLNARSESQDSVGSCSDGIDNDFDGKIDKADESCKPQKTILSTKS